MGGKGSGRPPVETRVFSWKAKCRCGSEEEITVVRRKGSCRIAPADWFDLHQECGGSLFYEPDDTKKFKASHPICSVDLCTKPGTFGWVTKGEGGEQLLYPLCKKCYLKWGREPYWSTRGEF